MSTDLTKETYKKIQLKSTRERIIAKLRHLMSGKGALSSLNKWRTGRDGLSQALLAGDTYDTTLNLWLFLHIIPVHGM